MSTHVDPARPGQASWSNTSFEATALEDTATKTGWIVAANDLCSQRVRSARVDRAGPPTPAAELIAPAARPAVAIAGTPRRTGRVKRVRTSELVSDPTT